MRVARLLVMLGLCALGLGCGSIIPYASYNLIVQPVQRMDDHLISARDTLIARAAWKEVQQANPDRQYSIHYARGFKCGFADFLDAGGSGEPPPVPPWRYRMYHYQTPKGHQEVADWFTGFRDGAALARSSGYRHYVIVPGSTDGSGPALGNAVSGASPGQAHAVTAADPVLPMPKSLPAANAPERRDAPPVKEP